MALLGSNLDNRKTGLDKNKLVENKPGEQVWLLTVRLLIA